MNDFSNFKVRASSLPDLMTNGKIKGELSKTAKSMLRKAWIKEVYGREKKVSTPAMQKGTMVESDIMDLYKSVTGELYFKNKKLFENDWIKGTPDIPAKERVIDTKASQDIWTYNSVEESEVESNYKWQVAGYAWLLGVKKGEVAYGLVDTPDALIFDEFRKLMYQGVVEEGNQKDEEMVRKMYTYNDIPAKERLKRFTFDFTDDDFKLIKDKVILAREYMGGLSL